jgi:hypothetical protein
VVVLQAFAGLGPAGLETGSSGGLATRLTIQMACNDSLKSSASTRGTPRKANADMKRKIVSNIKTQSACTFSMDKREGKDAGVMPRVAA